MVAMELKEFLTNLKKLGWLKGEIGYRSVDELAKQWEDDLYILQEDD